jgi:hypothetical protein
MKEQRRWLGMKESRTMMPRPPEHAAVAPPEGIPLLMLPEGVLFCVDASMLLGSLAPPDDIPDLAAGGVRRICSALIRLWLRSWEF